MQKVSGRGAPPLCPDQAAGWVSEGPQLPAAGNEDGPASGRGPASHPRPARGEGLRHLPLPHLHIFSLAVAIGLLLGNSLTVWCQVLGHLLVTDIPYPPLSGLALARPDQTRRTKVTNGTKMTKETHVSKALIPPRVIKIFIYTINMIRPVNGIYTVIDSWNTQDS